MIMAATGHRPDKLGGYSGHVDRSLRDLACWWLQTHRPLAAISGMALGWDMAWAEAAIECGVPLIAAVPFVGQERRWPAASQERHARILSGAATVKIVSEGEYAAWKLHRRNEWMVDAAHTVVALWDGSHGGTGACVAYAQIKRKPIVNLWVFR